MADPKIYFGLGGVFRDITITSSDIVACWPLDELTSINGGYNATARDIAYGRNPGQWNGASLREVGVPIGLPEGGLATGFWGGAYIEVPDDGEGYKLPGDSGPRNLSCYGGDIDIIGLIRTTMPSTGVRAGIIDKRQPTGEGWHVGLLNGTIVFALRNPNDQTVFSFVSSSSIADDQWHLFHCTFDATNGLVQILIDGVVSAWQATAKVEPTLTTGPLRIGRLFDGTGALTHTYLAYLAVHRAGDPTLSTKLQAARTWTYVPHLRAETVEWTRGMTGTTVRDRQAGIGTCSFVLDSGAKVPHGYYAIGHPNCRAGFTIGMPVGLNVIAYGGEHNMFLGRLLSVVPEGGEHTGGMRSHCMAGDWLAATSKATVSQVPVALNVRSDVAWLTLVEHAQYMPHHLYAAAGAEVFPFFGDVVDGALLGEMTKVIVSEGGYCYVTRNGTLVYEARGARQAASPLTPACALDKTMRGLTVEVSEERLINVVTVGITPRRVGPHEKMVLYFLERRSHIAALETVNFDVSYQDPDQSRSSVGMVEWQHFTAGIDYTFNGAEDGTGQDWTADISHVVDIGGSGARLAITNTSSEHDGWFQFYIRGRAIYTDIAISERLEDRDSVRQYGPMELSEDYPYLNYLATARTQAQATLALFAKPTAFPTSVVVRPVPGSLFERTVALCGISDLIALGEPMTGVAGFYWLQSVRATITRPNILEVEWGLFPDNKSAPWGVWDSSTWDNCLWGF